MHIHPYLVFNGNAAEAMAFYQHILGGKLDISHFSDMPDFAENFTPEDGNRVMHAQLRCEQAVLMASDSCPLQPTGAMDGFSVALVFTDLARAASVFEALGTGGTIIMPWAPTFWAAGFGMLKDQFGVNWMINSDLVQCGNTRITVQTSINAAIQDVWRAWTTPEDIKQWNTPSDDWHTTDASVDLRTGGQFNSRMEAKDGSMGFDFSGTYTKIVPNSLIESRLQDGRVVIVEFSGRDNNVTVRESFDPESMNSVEQQRLGWQAILDNFAKYVQKGKGHHPAQVHA